MKCLLLDNYDSFTYNLYHILRDFGVDTDVVRNDRITLDKIETYDKIILSPGPGIPSESGLLVPLVKRFAPTKSILGICLGHQAIGEAFEAKLMNLKEVYHGVCSDIRIIAKDPLFEGLAYGFRAGRYHSWVVSKNDFPESLEITAIDADEGQIMGIRHRQYDVRGIQFHPESILTPKGKTVIENWININ